MTEKPRLPDPQRRCSFRRGLQPRLLSPQRTSEAAQDQQGRTPGPGPASAGSNLNTPAASQAMEFREELREPSEAPTSDEARAEASSSGRAGLTPR